MSESGKASERAKMPEGSAPILENRSVEKDYRTLLPLLKPGCRILDVGCGTGTMTADMARLVGPSGLVHGVDNSEHLIERGKNLYAEIPNLELICADIFEFNHEKDYDLITAARVLQWLQDPLKAIKTFVKLLRPGGILSVLDYDHTAIEFEPTPPASMLYFYEKFLLWRSDAGMNNSIANDLKEYLKSAGFENIKILNADQSYLRGQQDFHFKANIWSDVAASRGRQLVAEGYLSEGERIKAIEEYSFWVEHHAQSMVMKLNDVRGQIPIKE